MAWKGEEGAASEPLLLGVPLGELLPTASPVTNESRWIPGIKIRDTNNFEEPFF